MLPIIEKICGHPLEGNYRPRLWKKNEGIYIRIYNDKLPEKLNDIESRILSYIKLIAEENGIKIKNTF